MDGSHKLGLSMRGYPTPDTSARHSGAKTYKDEEAARQGRDPDSVLSHSYLGRDISPGSCPITTGTVIMEVVVPTLTS